MESNLQTVLKLILNVFELMRLICIPSCSELKKRLKNREKEAKKAEKAATTPAPAVSDKAGKKTVSAAEEEESLNPNVRYLRYTRDGSLL
jgi:hypothetical protein